MAICLFFFAFSTILGWHFFGQVNVEYLFGTKATKFYSFFVIVFVIVGSTLKVDFVWSLSDFFNGLMVIPQCTRTLGSERDSDQYRKEIRYKKINLYQISKEGIRTKTRKVFHPGALFFLPLVHSGMVV